MMENNKSSAGSGLLAGLGGGLSGGAGGLQGLSPYLNIDPSYLQTSAPEYLFDQEAKRGKMEKSFTAIGTAVCVGAALGGAYGLYDGIRQTALSDFKGKLRRTQVMNYTIKSGATVSNALGSIAVVYSGLYCLLSLVQEEDVEAKSILSGTLTGLLFKSTAGVRKCALGGAFGLGLATLWSFGLKKQERIQNFM